MTDLIEIDGVGPSYAEDLQDAGFDTAEDVASAEAADLDDVLDRADGESLVENARDEVWNGDDGSPDGSDESDTITIDPGFSETQLQHMLHALVGQELRYRRVNNIDGIDRVQRAVKEIRTGEPFELTIDQCSDIYTGVNQLEESYRSERNIDGLTGDIREVTQFFQNLRSQHQE